MRYLLFFLLFGLFSAASGRELLYSIEITPETLADIDIRQNVAFKRVENGKNAILITPKAHAWMYLKKDPCVGKEIIAVFRYKAVKKGNHPKKARALLRYASGEVYHSGKTGQPVDLTVGDEWKTASCSMKYPEKFEDAIILFSASDGEYFVTDIKIYRKK